MIHMTAPGIDTDAIIRDIHESVKQKAESGCYQAAGLGDPGRFAPLDFRDNAAFLAFYLETLRESAFVDIGDFEIVEKRQRFRGLLVGLKKAIWSMLRFYTYRLWSQQNQINGLLLAAIEGLHDQQNEKIRALEARINTLESALNQREAG
jgi:hypothetical protein